RPSLFPPHPPARPSPSPLSLHDALPIYLAASFLDELRELAHRVLRLRDRHAVAGDHDHELCIGELNGGIFHPDRANRESRRGLRSEEHTSELQSRSDLVCRLLLEKKKKK